MVSFWKRLFLGLFLSFTPVVFAEESAPAPWRVTSREEIATVWSGNPVGFCFKEKEGILFAGFYSADKNMVIGQKNPGETWKFQTLPTKIGWDSHNFIAMEFDRENKLHVSGNMHCVPLIYFRAEKPLDIESLRPVHRMVAEDTTPEARRAALEHQVTYPIFLFHHDGRLLFNYRHGSSGNGIALWNVYDEKTQTWSRFLDKPLTDGKGKCNAYATQPTLGKDGFYHVAYVWRDTGDCATNHDLSYLRSRDLIHWEKSDGTSLEIPVTPDYGEIIAPLKPGEGLLNAFVRVGFDQENRVIITYTRYDENENLQLMQARREKDGWKIYQTSDWTHRWIFSGYGCIPTELGFGNISIDENGDLVQYWNRKHESSGEFVLDPATLRPIRHTVRSAMPKECYQVENPQPNQRLKSASLDLAPNKKLFFVWETLPINRDQPHDVVPVPSTLRMFVLER